VVTIMRLGLVLALLFLPLALPGCASSGDVPAQDIQAGDFISLPEASLEGKVSVEEALFERRSIREYSDASLSLEEVSQLLWAAQGMTADWGGRTAPSAGALYPLEVVLVAGNVEGLDAGVYRYEPPEHRLAAMQPGDIRGELAVASLGQSSVSDGAIVLVIGAVYERTTAKYGERGVRYVHMEAGHAAQNVCLQATALGLGNAVVGAFSDSEVKETLGLAEDEAPLYVIPVGRVGTDAA